MTDARDRLRRATVAAYRPTAAESDASAAHASVPATPARRRERRRRGVHGIRALTAARVGIMVLVLGLLGAGVLMVSQRSSGSVTPLPRPEPVPVTASQTPVPELEERALVHVAGAVREPGLVALAPEARVADALDAAGGALASADLDAVNLAAPVTDGQQVYLPTEGEGAPPAGSGSGSPGADGTGHTDPPVVDINAADAAALESLPGIGPARAAEIIAWREEAGGFSSVDELLEVSGIGPATLERLRDRVRV